MRVGFVVNPEINGSSIRRRMLRCRTVGEHLDTQGGPCQATVAPSVVQKPRSSDSLCEFSTVASGCSVDAPSNRGR